MNDCVSVVRILRWHSAQHPIKFVETIEFRFAANTHFSPIYCKICIELVCYILAFYIFCFPLFSLCCRHPASAANKKNIYIGISQFDCLSSSKLIRCIRLRAQTQTRTQLGTHTTPPNSTTYTPNHYPDPPPPPLFVFLSTRSFGSEANNGKRNTHTLNRMNVMRWFERNWNMEEQTDRNFQYVIMRTNLFDVDIVCWQLWADEWTRIPKVLRNMKWMKKKEYRSGGNCALHNNCDAFARTTKQC